jgi:glc operon protein GlcG
MADTAATRSLTLDGARCVLDAALAKAADLGIAFCIVVTDPSGEPLITARMDGAPRLSAGIAANKAYTVTGFGGMPTAQWWEVIKNEPALVHGITHTPRLIIFGGGVGIMADGQLVGAIGVSGGSAEDDTLVAEAGSAALAG